MAALAPLLAISGGCGSDTVPIGRDGTEGKADSGGGSGGYSGSSSTGGTSSVGGTSSAGGTSSVGGSGSGSGAGGSKIGETPEGACLETVTPFDRQNLRGIELWPQNVELMLALKRRARLTWVDGTEAHLDFALVGVSVYVVESTPNPDFDDDVPVTCENHLRGIATGRLTSSDGRVDETLPGMQFDFGTEMRDGFEITGAYAATTIERDRLRGSYATRVSSNECLLSLEFQATLDTFGFQGSIVESVGSMPCGTETANDAVLERDTGQWRCDDEGCPAEVISTLDVEAESCDGIGEQLTQAGDESTFARSGDTVARGEDYGCGCALYPDFVVAWTPRSPLELRLCSHDSRNTCLAACYGNLSYDLSTAFRVSGASEYRFVD